MKKIKFKYEYIVFLYAYLRQIDLSLDRSRWGNWGDLIEYYKDQIQPMTVAKSLQKNSNFKPSEIFADISIKKPNFIGKCCLFLSSAVMGRPYMTANETQYCYQLLIRFDFFLSADLNKYSLEMEKLRVDIAKFYYTDVLEYRLWPKDRNHAMYIECFFQSENIKPVKMDEFIKGILL